MSMTAKAPLAYEVVEAAPLAEAEAEAEVAEPLPAAVAEPVPLEVEDAVVDSEAIVAAIASAVALRVPHCWLARHAA